MAVPGGQRWCGDDDLVTLGLAPKQADLLTTTTNYCDGRVAPDSIYAVLYRECFNLFPDDMFADLFTDVGRRSVPPMIIAVVMVLQRIEGLSDREAVDRFCFDARWKYAAGGLDFDYPGFVHTVLVDMRARLSRSERPDRIFETTLDVATRAGLVGRKRVLDSTPVYDAVATMDTVTLVRSAIRGLLKVADSKLAAELRSQLARDDDYAAAGKPVCDYDDRQAREALVDALAQDATALLQVLDGRELDPGVDQAGKLLATVVGQDLDQVDGVFQIAWRVATDRVISTVDPQARHGHKTSARGFDGYKGHVAIDPDSELVTATTVTAGNVGDGAAAEDLIGDLVNDPVADPAATTHDQPEPEKHEPGPGDDPDNLDHEVAADAAADNHDDATGAADVANDRACVYGDNAYGTGPLQDWFEQAGIESKCKTPQPVAAGGLFSKNQFAIDLDADQVTCPAGHTAPIRRNQKGAGAASFGSACTDCPLQAQCTTAAAGRTIGIGIYERQLAAARTRQQDPGWMADYRATRPKVERKIGHLMRRRHGGRRARVRGQTKIAADFTLLAAATNIARLGILGIQHRAGQTWTAAAC